MPLKISYNDLIELAKSGEFDVIAHGCNCFCVQGKGIAWKIRQTYPEAYEADLKTVKGDRSKLGTYSMAVVGDLTILNLYTQYRYGSKERPDIDYFALEACMQKIKQDFSGKKIGMPMIGAGLANGDWTIIKQIIAEQLNDEDVTVVVFNDKYENYPTSEA